MVASPECDAMLSTALPRDHFMETKRHFEPLGASDPGLGGSMAWKNALSCTGTCWDSQVYSLIQIFSIEETVVNPKKDLTAICNHIHTNIEFICHLQNTQNVHKT